MSITCYNMRDMNERHPSRNPKYVPLVSTAEHRMRMKEMRIFAALESSRSEINRLKTHNRKLAEESERDALTGLMNRTALLRSWTSFVSALGRGGWKIGTLVYIDLNGFKPVNDYLGHAMGDLLLIELGKLFTASLRPSDSVFRIGGDEFIILLPGASRDYATTIIERLRIRARDIFMDQSEARKLAEINGRGAVVDFSAGYCTITADDIPHSLDHVLEHADGDMPKMASKRELFANASVAANEPPATAGIIPDARIDREAALRNPFAVFIDELSRRFR